MRYSIAMPNALCKSFITCAVLVSLLLGSTPATAKVRAKFSVRQFLCVVLILGGAFGQGVSYEHSRLVRNAQLSEFLRAGQGAEGNPLLADMNDQQLRGLATSRLVMDGMYSFSQFIFLAERGGRNFTLRPNQSHLVRANLREAIAKNPELAEPAEKLGNALSSPETFAAHWGDDTEIWYDPFGFMAAARVRRRANVARFVETYFVLVAHRLVDEERKKGLHVLRADYFEKVFRDTSQKE